MTPPPLTSHEHRRLLDTALRVREGILTTLSSAGSGHVGGALSQTDLLVTLYERYLRIDPTRPTEPERDRFVLSKGHGGLGLAVVLAERGFVSRETLASFGQPGSTLGMHLDHRKVPGVEASTGSLGHGLGVAVGMALGAQLHRWSSRTYCLLSDGECHEGSTWEAALAAPAFRLGRLCALIDRNRLTMDGPTEEQVPIEPLADKWRAFGWRVARCDGHDLRALCEAFDTFVHAPSEQPTVIIADTVKGKGVDFMEERPGWHYGALDSGQHAAALASVRAQHARAMERAR